MIFAGKLTETLSIYRVEEVQGRTGYKDTSEEFVCDVLAERLKNKENYVVDAGELFHDLELSFRLRNRKEIVEVSIIKYNGERYRVTSIDRYPRDNEMVIKIMKINE
jgi:hypothetical protein